MPSEPEAVASVAGAARPAGSARSAGRAPDYTHPAPPPAALCSGLVGSHVDPGAGGIVGQRRPPDSPLDPEC
jgi:hypothetical protein